MAEATYERSSGFFKQFQKNRNFLCRKKNIIIFVSQTLPFACIFRIFTLIINLLIITTKTVFSSRSFTVYKYLFSPSDTLKAKGDVFLKTSAGSGVQQKQFQRILKSRHYCFRTKTFANVYEKSNKQNSTTRMLTRKLCWTQKFGSKDIEAEKSTLSN